jgi:hypothetical protein
MCPFSEVCKLYKKKEPNCNKLYVENYCGKERELASLQIGISGYSVLVFVVVAMIVGILIGMGL